MYKYFIRPNLEDGCNSDTWKIILYELTVGPKQSWSHVDCDH